MKLLITGGSGTLGREITKLAIANNHQVNILTRNKKLVSNNINLKYSTNFLNIFITGPIL